MLEVFIMATRESFTQVQLNVTLKTTQISSYYVSKNVSDVNCNLPLSFTYTYPFDDFMIDTNEGMNQLETRYLYEEYPNKLCPMSSYETSLVVFNYSSSSGSNVILYKNFTTGKI